ncbi:MAG: PAS domain-containing sensor histidine kinase [Candidatus Thermoplasmatota archaeon]|nr:PAS domain-containing sensor histidine kinase [Candidatus Thermoplasmatota archaeon]
MAKSWEKKRISSKGAKVKDESKTKKQIIKELEGLCQQVTELEKVEAECKRMEGELQKSEEKYRGLVRNAVEGIYRSTVDGGILEANPALLEFFGYESEEKFEAISPYQVFVNREDRENFLKELKEKGEVKGYEIEYKRKDGKVVIGNEFARLIEEDGKKIIEGIIHDITERKKMENAIIQLNEVLHLINKIMGHDILNDLQVVSGALELYSESKDKKLLDKAHKRIARSVELIRRMRNLESLVASGGELTKHRVKEVVEDVIKKYSVDINVEGDGIVLADDAIYSVIDNIVNNAIVHGKTNKTNITIESKDNFCEIKIADYGKGIPDEIKEKVFDERFSHGERGGMGLGLYIVKKNN